MVDKYFVRYDSLSEEQYSLPSDLQKRIEAISGLRIIFESDLQPVLIVEASPEAIDQLELLEKIVSVYPNTTFQPLDKKR